ncbi:MAG: putative zinc-binding metallopeptidase [Bacteroides sp.]|nr:putative zinc-binding metallopeptidase [Bacteroides sp.]
MKQLKYMLLFSLLLWGTTSCSDDSLDDNSIFDTEAVERNEFDTWLLNNYVYPYNIDFKYRMEYKESDTSYNLVPADFDKSVAMAKLVKYLWIDSYVEVMGNQRSFICTYGPKMIHLIGSPAYDEGQIKLGTAEGGLKVTLYNVNALDADVVDVAMLNRWYFRTMHHEFAHILHQTIEFQQEFYEISSGQYTGSGWVNISDETALARGFITAYGSNEVHEDFAEMVSNYVTHDADWWSEQMSIAGSGATYIEQKLELVKEYMTDSWEIDLDSLRDIVQRRSEQVIYLDLKNLND